MRLFILFFIFNVFAVNDSSKVISKEEQVQKAVNYDNIQKVLEEDGLKKELDKKQKLVEKIKEEQQRLENMRHSYPLEGEFWRFISEYWLVKNSQKLQWDTPRPNYGILPMLKSFFEKLGYYHYTFKILIVNSPVVTHMALPTEEKEGIYLISLPFIRTLDLSKVEICLLILEDFLRLQDGHFVTNIGTFQKLWEKDFGKEGPDKKAITEILEKYNEVVFKKGFTFKQQFEITKKMDQLLKNDPKSWGRYYNLLGKIDELTKTNALYKGHNTLYPSAEIQQKWLRPPKKNL